MLDPNENSDKQIEDLRARVSRLEGPSSLQSRIDQSAADDAAKRAGFTRNPASGRRDDLKRTSQELRGHTAPARPAKASPSASGDPIEFYCWKNGVMGKITLAATTGFTEL